MEGHGERCATLVCLFVFYIVMKFCKIPHCIKVSNNHKFLHFIEAEEPVTQSYISV